MSYNPVYDYVGTSGSDRPERVPPCSRCKNTIALSPPNSSLCWACYSGWPSVTRPQYKLANHPNYVKYVMMLRARAVAKLMRKQTSESYVEAMPFL